MSVTEPNELNDNQKELFNAIESSLRKETALEYIKGGYDSGIKAYKVACENLSKKPSKNPDVSSAEILNYPSVVRFINSVRIEVAKETQIDAKWALKAAKKIYDRCMQFEQLTNRDGSPVMVELENGEMCAAYKFDSTGANKALDTICKHVDVKAFAEEKTASFVVKNIMPVPTADSISGWEQTAQNQQSEILGRKDEV